MSGRQLLVRWKSIGSIAPEWEATFWGRVDQYNFESGPTVVPHIEASAAGTDLIALAYSASNHTLVIRDSSVAMACAGPEVSDRTRVALFACDLASPEVEEGDLDAVLNSQVPASNICHSFRTRDTDSLAVAIATLIPICLTSAGITPLDRLQSADSQRAEGGPWWKGYRNQ